MRSLVQSALQTATTNSNIHDGQPIKKYRTAFRCHLCLSTQSPSRNSHTLSCICQYLHLGYSGNIIITYRIKTFQITFALREEIFRMTKGGYTVTKYKLREFIFKLRMENLKLGVVAQPVNLALG